MDFDRPENRCPILGKEKQTVALHIGGGAHDQRPPPINAKIKQVAFNHQFDRERLVQSRNAIDRGLLVLRQRRGVRLSPAGLFARRFKAQLVSFLICA